MQSFSRRSGRGKKPAAADAAPDIGGGGSSKDAKADGGDAAIEVDAEETVVAKPSFKVGAQADPLRDAIQAEAVALFDASQYDEAGEKVRLWASAHPFACMFRFHSVVCSTLALPHIAFLHARRAAVLLPRRGRAQRQRLAAGVHGAAEHGHVAGDDGLALRGVAVL